MPENETNMALQRNRLRKLEINPQKEIQEVIGYESTYLISHICPRCENDD